MSIQKLSANALFGTPSPATSALVNFGANNHDDDLEIFDPQSEGKARQTSATNTSGKTSAQDFITQNPTLPFDHGIFVEALEQINQLKALRAYIVALNNTVSEGVYNLMENLSGENAILAYRSTSLAASQHTPEVIFGSPTTWNHAAYTLPDDAEATLENGEIYIPATWVGSLWATDGTESDAAGKKTIKGRPLSSVALPLDNKGTLAWYASKHSKSEKVEDTIEYNNDLIARGMFANVFNIGIGVKAQDVRDYNALSAVEKAKLIQPYKARAIALGVPDLNKAESENAIPQYIARFLMDQWIERYNAPRLEGAQNLQWLKEWTRSGFGGYALGVPRQKPSLAYEILGSLEFSDAKDLASMSGYGSDLADLPCNKPGGAKSAPAQIPSAPADLDLD